MIFYTNPHFIILRTYYLQNLKGKVLWYIFITPATQEAEIKRKLVKGQKLVRPHISTNKTGMVAPICNSSYVEDTGGSWSKAGLGKKCKTLSEK
jgi:hypothetical protein